MSRFTASNEDSIVVLKSITDPGEPDKVMPTLEQALEGVVIEWEN
jgi:hypothetical protein